MIALCFALMMCDAYDVAVLSYAAPAVGRTWAISGSAIGLIFSAGLFGLLVGSIGFGRLGDRIGRRRAVIAGAALFSVLTGLTALSASPAQLALLRFLAGLGLGGAIPNAVALTLEHAPRRQRVTAVGIIYAGYTVGGVVAGLIAAVLLAHDGSWRMLFVVGSAASAMTTLVLVAALPESPGFADAGGDGTARPAAPPITAIFAGRLRIVTPLLWTIYVASSLALFSLTSWMPSLAARLGFSPGASAIATASLFVGGGIGGVVAGRLADRWGFAAIIGLALLAIPAVAFIGQVPPVAVALSAASFVAGLLAMGLQTSLHGVAGTSYPADLRAAGVGMAMGVGKIGSIVGPPIAGVLLDRMSGPALFACAAAPFVIVVGAGSAMLRRVPARPAAPRSV